MIYELLKRDELESLEGEYISREESKDLYNVFNDVKRQRILRSKDRKSRTSMFLKVNEEGKYYLPIETRKRLSEIQKKGNLNSVKTRFKSREENPNSKKVEVHNIETGEKNIV